MTTEAQPLSEPTSAKFAPSSARTWRTGLTAIGVALAANLLVLVIATSAGAAMVVARMPIGVFAVIMATVVPLLIATLVLLALRRWGLRAWRVLAMVGLVFGLVSSLAPITVPADGPTRAALAAMHVITGVIWFLVVRRAAARAVA